MTYPEMTPKNIAGMVLSVLLMIAGIIYGMYAANENAQVNIEKFQNLSLSQLGTYIVEKNPGVSFREKSIVITNFIDPQKADAIMKAQSDQFQHEQKQNFLDEDCNHPLFRTYMQKGGVIYYLYLFQTGQQVNFLLDFNNTIAQCPKNI